MTHGTDLKKELGGDFYDFLDILPPKKMFVDTSIIYPGTIVTEPEFDTVNPHEILESARRAHNLTTTLIELGNYRITPEVFTEFLGITYRIRNLWEKANKKARNALPDEEERLKQIATNYAQIVSLYKQQSDKLETIIRVEQTNEKIKEILLSLIKGFGLDTKEVIRNGTRVKQPAASTTDIELVLSTIQSAVNQPTGVISLDQDIAQVFALCSMMFYDKRSPLNGLVRTDPINITAHYFESGQPYHEDATTIQAAIRAIPPERENEFFARLNEEYGKRYTEKTKSGRVTITTVIEEPKLN